MPKANLRRRAVRGMARIGEPGEALSIEQLTQRIAGIEALLAYPDDPTSAHDYSDLALATVAARVYGARRRRERYFDPAIFADPAWDMLLDLFIAQARGKQLRTVSLCIASNVPWTTALRWIGVLEKQGLIERRLEPDDRRAKLTVLTSHGYRVMRQYLIEGIEASDLPTGGGFG